MLRKLRINFVLLFVISICSANNGRPINHDDLFGFAQLGSPQISPDGKQIAYVITTYNKTDNSRNRDIWIIPVAGGEPQKITTWTGTDNHPRWSPDGSQIAYHSNSTGTMQIFIYDIESRQGRQFTSLESGASSPHWSNDGQTLAFVSDVISDENLKAEWGDQVEAKTSERLLYRHWADWHDNVRSHVFVQNLDSETATDATPGDYDTPPISLGGSQDYVFTPDGKSLVFVKNTDPVIARSTNNDLFQVNLTTGDEVKITNSPANDNSPSFSPDGTKLVWRAMDRPGFEADTYNLMVKDLASGQIKDITRALDRSVRSYTWSPDGTHIYFLAENEGYISTYRVPVVGGTIEELTTGTYDRYLQLTSDGNTLVYLREAMNSPAELFSRNIADGTETQLTTVNADRLANIEMNAAEEFWFTGAAKTQVHGFLLKPPGFDPEKKYPLIYVIHGGPQNMFGNRFHYRWNAQMFAAPGYIVVMVNPRGSSGYGQQFTDEISRDWGGKVYKDLMAGLDYVLDTYDFIDSDRLAAMGGSFGGYMVNWMEGHTDRFTTFISHAGLFNLTSMYYATEELWFVEWDLGGTPWEAPKLYKKWSPHNFVKNFKTPMLVIHGAGDFRVPIGEGLQMYTALQAMGVESKLLYYPDEGHWILKPQNSELWYDSVHEWLARYLK
jgi:dipeptidyl aminopeptidase/acylaminoacyl peptidase